MASYKKQVKGRRADGAGPDGEAVRAYVEKSTAKEKKGPTAAKPNGSYMGLAGKSLADLERMGRTTGIASRDYKYAPSGSSGRLSPWGQDPYHPPQPDLFQISNPRGTVDGGMYGPTRRPDMSTRGGLDVAAALRGADPFGATGGQKAMTLDELVTAIAKQKGLLGGAGLPGPTGQSLIDVAATLKPFQMERDALGLRFQAAQQEMDRLRGERGMLTTANQGAYGTAHAANQRDVANIGQGGVTNNAALQAQGNAALAAAGVQGSVNPAVAAEAALMQKMNDQTASRLNADAKSEAANDLRRSADARSMDSMFNQQLLNNKEKGLTDLTAQEAAKRVELEAMNAEIGRQNQAAAMDYANAQRQSMLDQQAGVEAIRQSILDRAAKDPNRYYQFDDRQNVLNELAKYGKDHKYAKADDVLNTVFNEGYNTPEEALMRAVQLAQDWEKGGDHTIGRNFLQDYIRRYYQTSGQLTPTALQQFAMEMLGRTSI